MRSVSGTLASAQQPTSSSGRVPYFKLLFTSKDGLTTRDLSSDSVAYGNRILLIDHVEEAYNDYAVILLRNSDKGIPAINGYWTEIGYGDVTGAGKEYVGDGTSEPATPRLWVKSQQTVEAAGKLYTILELEGTWARLREELIRLGDPPYYINKYSATTAYAILEAIIETEMGWSLAALGGQDDSIINTLSLNFDINTSPFEYAAGIIYRLLRHTKCLLRASDDLGFEVRYPQAADSVDISYYDYQAPFYYSYTNRVPVLTPNDFDVFGNAGSDGKWASYVTGEATDSTSANAYATITDLALAPYIVTEANVDLLAAALLSKVKAEAIFGKAVIPHDCRVEMLDKLAFYSTRGGATTYPSDGTVRVGGLRHTYKPGSYRLEIMLGGVSMTSDMAQQVGRQTIVFNDTEAKSMGVAEHPLYKPPAPTPSPSGVAEHPIYNPHTPIYSGVAEHPLYNPPPTSPEVRLIPSIPGIWSPDMTMMDGGYRPPASQPTIPQAISKGVQAGLIESVLMPVHLLQGAISPIWQKITPWNEQAGETFGSTIQKAASSVADWWESLFK